MACSQRLLVDNGTDVQTFGHLYIVQVFHHGYRLANTQALGSKTSQDVGLGIVRESYEGLRVLDTFFLKQAQVASVTMYNHGIDIIQQFVQLLATGFVYLDNLQVHIVGSRLGHTYGSLATTHDDDILDVGIVLLA